MENKFLGKMSLLVDFNCLIDEDIGVINYVRTQYRENAVFAFTPIKDLDTLETLGIIYRRKCRNPLHIIMRDIKYKDLLDRCYNEYLAEHEEEILKYSYVTEVSTAVTDYFNQSGDIIPTIMYYNDTQLEELNKKEEFKDIQKVSYSYARQNIKKYNIFFFKYIETFEKFKDILENSVVYLSSCGVNLNEDNEDFTITNDVYIDMISKNVKFAIFDMYNMTLIGDYKHGNS